jgi:hypothetical protein
VLFAICSAQVRVAARRAAGAFATAPLVVSGAAVAAALLPAGAWWAGLHAAPALRDGDPTVIALGAGLAAALAGGFVTLLAPGARVLGSQLDAAPIPQVRAFVGLRLFAPLAALVLLALPVVVFVVAAARGATPLVLVRLLGAAALGAAGTEAALALARRSFVGLPTAAAVALLLLARDSVLLAPGAVAVWTAALALRPAERVARAQVNLLARSRAATAAMRYARRRDLRRQAAVGMGLAVTGAVALRALDVPHDVAVLFGGVTAVLGAAVFPLAAPGLDRRANWLWRSVPVRPATLALVHGAVALALAFVLAAAGVTLTFAAAPTRPAVVLPLGAATSVLLGSALLGGSLVPWRAERLGDQLGSYAAFGVVAAAVAFVLARIAPVIGAEHGLRAGGLAAAALCACAGTATLATARRA